MNKNNNPMPQTPKDNIIDINESLIHKKLDDIVRGTVEDTVNKMLDEEANLLLGAEKYERSEGRRGNRAGHYERKLHTKAGEVTLKMPKLKKVPFETAIIQRYRTREASIEESLIEMYLAGVSVRRVEDITEALWGTRVSPSTVSKLNQTVYSNIEKWRNKPIKKEYPYVYLDGIVLKRTWAGEVKNVSVLVAIGVSEEGYRDILGISEGPKEDKEGWSSFLGHLKERGLKGIELITSDKCIGLVESVGEHYPAVKWQRCTVHFYRNVFSKTPNTKIRQVSVMLKAIHAQEDYQNSLEKGKQVVERLKEMKLVSAAKVVEEGLEETLSYTFFPEEHWKRIRTNNPLERLMREIRRRTRVVGNFPDGYSALMLASARLRHIAGTKWSTKKYLSMECLKKHKLESQVA